MFVKIKLKDGEEELKDDQNLEQFEKNDPQFDNIDPALNQITEEFLSSTSREVQGTRSRKQKDEKSFQLF